MLTAWGPEGPDALITRLAGTVARGRLCPQCGADTHGQPWVKGYAGASIAHAGRLSVVALATHPVGVDVEAVGADVPAEVVRHPDDPELAPVELWVAKEAALKASGHGLTVDPRDLLVCDDTVTGPTGVWRISRLDIASHVALAAAPLP